jgi:hypothetical protein
MSDDNNPFESQRAGIIEAHILSGYPKDKAEFIADLSVKTAEAAFMVVEMGAEVGGSIGMSLSIATTTMQLIADHARGFVEAMKEDPKAHVLSALEQAYQNALGLGDRGDVELLEQYLTKARSPDFDITLNRIVLDTEDAPTKH